MMHLITPDYYGAFAGELAEMYRLRYRVFKERLAWDVQVSGDMEIDEFDALHPAYLIQRASDSRIQGCVRLLPSNGPTMLRDAFPVLLEGAAPPCSPAIWESSRFALDLRSDLQATTHGLAAATYELLAGMIEFGLSRPTYRDRDRYRCSNGAHIAPRRMAIAANRQTSRLRQHTCGCRISRNFN